jgi:parvulin-like peptidyl-prolyl isomerase
VPVTKEDLERGFIANYGPRVRCRVIMVTNQRRAQEVWEMARAELQKKNPDPEFFGRLAEQYSVDPSRAVQGRVPPIQRYGGMSQLEDAAFALKPSELSGLIAVGDRFVILYCEGYTEPVKVEMADVKDVLNDDIQQKKLHMAMAEEFNRLRESAQIDNYLTGTSQAPKRSGAAGHGNGEKAAAINANPSADYRK